MGTAKKAKYPIGFYICCITYTFERFAFYGTKPLLALFLAASVAEGGIGVTKAQAGEIAVWLTSLTYITPIVGGWLSDRFLGPDMPLHLDVSSWVLAISADGRHTAYLWYG